MLYAIAYQFAKRIRSPEQSAHMPWAKFAILFQPKTHKANSMNQMRGIALLNALLKWYLATLTMLIERELLPLIDDSALIVGGEKGCAASLVFTPLQLLAQKSAE